ncbi:MAG: GH3 auxin-responsive promoter family protein [Bacteroidales bacterium]
MSLINSLYIKFSLNLLRELEQSKKAPFEYQIKCFNNLIKCGRETAFGKEHCFEKINSIKEFQKNIPIRDYNKIAPYIARLKNGENYVLWNQKVKWFAKSSGTSSDKSKFIPITPNSLNITHYGGFKRMLASYINTNPKSKLCYGKALTLGGSVSPDSQNSGYALSGDLSAILLRNSPSIVELIRTPKKETALIDDFGAKIEKICKESSRQNVTNFAGVPSWNLILLNKILEYTGKSNIVEVWPNLELFMHGGIGFEPYREIFRKIIPLENMHYLENYNASEGYFAFQDDLKINSMLLTVNNGVFYEFIPMNIIDKVLNMEITEIPTLNEVKVGVNYAIVISTVGGLWRYLIGDCVKFTSLFPHRIKITGRTQLFINAFGEELMIENAERALANACKLCNCSICDFTVAPVFMEFTSNGTATKGYHKWAIEFITPPQNISNFEKILDYSVTEQNSDYEAKRKNSATMEQLKIISLTGGTFYKWMENRNKLGGQNKVPRLYSNSCFIDELITIK